MLIKDLVVGAWYRSPRANYPLCFNFAKYRVNYIVEFRFTQANGLTFVFPCTVPPWANELAEIDVEPLSSLELELM